MSGHNGRISNINFTFRHKKSLTIMSQGSSLPVNMKCQLEFSPMLCGHVFYPHIPMGMNKVYYLPLFIYLKSTYLNGTYTQRYENLKVISNS
jgi:hypothetical protein